MDDTIESPFEGQEINRTDVAKEGGGKDHDKASIFSSMEAQIRS